MNALTYVSVVIAVLTTIASIFSTDLQSFFAAHSTFTALVVGIWGVIAHYLPSQSSTINSAAGLTTAINVKGTTEVTNRR